MLKSHHIWERHPGVRGPSELTFGERAADQMRRVMGSWGFVFGFVAFMGVWATLNTIGLVEHWDVYPFVLLNLFLSMLAGLQGAILLIAAKRSDQIAAELAQHDYDTNRQALDILKLLRANLVATQGLSDQLDEMTPESPPV